MAFKYLSGFAPKFHFPNSTTAKALQNNANEGTLIVPATINTQTDLIAWLKSQFPNLSDKNIISLLAAYPSSSNAVNASDPRYETNGYGPGTAVNVSQVGTGQQQRAYVCPPLSSLLNPRFKSSKVQKFKRGRDRRADGKC
jgi:hypothetical protein